MCYGILKATRYRAAPIKVHLVDKADISRYVHLIFLGESQWYISRAKLL